ncbi:hypothetical protein H6F67_27260 [Microcoleus sp. FACHB-1515]|uniref:hypothetical protein n=1 Tax=Cyanophyceae TaxID=3028117 RepID=UPI00168407FB|nr:hypothetical protein [Microcoleus sp. FACHB-1515]MBD2093538.1 hypothetical protein [Microcoleus sp. FACHB-1515]
MSDLFDGFVLAWYTSSEAFAVPKIKANYRIDPIVDQKIRSIASEQQSTPSAIVRAAIDKYLAEMQKPLSV